MFDTIVCVLIFYSVPYFLIVIYREVKDKKFSPDHNLNALISVHKYVQK